MEDNKTPGDEDLDALLRDFLSAQLDPQLGRAARRFHEHHHRQAAPTLAPGLAPPRRALGGWMIGVAGGAMAASIAALWAGPSLWHAAPPDRPPAPVIPVAAQYNFDLDAVTLSTQTRDAGTVLLDGRTPARKIVRNELKQIRWVDPERDVSVERIEPRQTIMLIEMDTY